MAGYWRAVPLIAGGAQRHAGREGSIRLPLPMESETSAQEQEKHEPRNKLAQKRSAHSGSALGRTIHLIPPLAGTQQHIVAAKGPDIDQNQKMLCAQESGTWRASGGRSLCPGPLT
jgi:hypothetical protein